jgi:RNA polymerase sigma-70 factor (ECF subfamily)
MTPGTEIERLAAAARHGDDTAVAQLVRLTQPVVWRMCRSMGSGFETDDLVQDVYLRALRSLPSYEGEARAGAAGFVAWLLTIARRVCADEVRRAQRQRRLIDRIGASALPPTAGPAPTGDLDDLVAALDTDRREAFVLTQVVGLTYDEAAAVCGCPVGTIRSRVARARADLVGMVARAQAR